MFSGSPGFPSVEEKIETDARSIYVGNVGEFTVLC